MIQLPNIPLPNIVIPAQIALPSTLAQTDVDRTIEREQYVPFNLARIKVTVGEIPDVLIMAAFGSSEAGEGGRNEESLQIRFPSTNLAIALLTRTGLGDDSVYGLRYRIELVKQENQQWRIVWVGLQTKCHQDRGHQYWQNKRCS